MNSIEKPISTFLPLLRDETNPLIKAKIETTVRRGLTLIPISSTVKERIAEVWDYDPEKLDAMDDDGILTLAYKAIDDTRIIEALKFHARVVQGVFENIFPEQYG